MSPVVSTGAPKVRSGETIVSANIQQKAERRSLRVATLRSAPVETTELCRCASYFFSMFQKTGTGETTLPDTFFRIAMALLYWPRKACVGTSAARS